MVVCQHLDIGALGVSRASESELTERRLGGAAMQTASVAARRDEMPSCGCEQEVPQ